MTGLTPGTMYHYRVVLVTQATGLLRLDQL